MSQVASPRITELKDSAYWLEFPGRQVKMMVMPFSQPSGMDLNGCNSTTIKARLMGMFKRMLSCVVGAICLSLWLLDAVAGGPAIGLPQAFGINESSHHAAVGGGTTMAGLRGEYFTNPNWSGAPPLFAGKCASVLIGVMACPWAARPPSRTVRSLATVSRFVSAGN